MPQNKQLTFTVNNETMKAIEALKKTFNVETTAAVLRRALALARVAAQNASEEDHTITIIDKHDAKQKILLTG